MFTMISATTAVVQNEVTSPKVDLPHAHTLSPHAHASLQAAE